MEMSVDVFRHEQTEKEMKKIYSVGAILFKLADSRSSANKTAGIRKRHFVPRKKLREKFAEFSTKFKEVREMSPNRKHTTKYIFFRQGYLAEISDKTREQKIEEKTLYSEKQRAKINQSPSDEQLHRGRKTVVRPS